MSKELLQKVIDKGVEGYLNEFFLDVSKYYTEMEDGLFEYDGGGFSDFQAIGEINFSPGEKLVVVTTNIAGDLTERSGKKAQYEKAKKILKQYMRYDAGIFVFSDTASNFRLSLVYGTPDATRMAWSNFRRFTYFVSKELTNNTFKKRVGECSFSSLEAIKDAFSVEKVNKEFYAKIAEFFYRLTGKTDYEREMLLPSVGEDDNKTYEEFAVRLIGRSVFCWFLKHKKSVEGIPLIAKEALSVAAVQNHSNYYHSILEPLFFELMNTPIKDRKSVTIPEAGNVPFLNGGLFEPHENDFYKPSLINVLKIPDKWFTDFFTVLEQYNFTIDENSTVDADVSVDPEMLGRIFENLLAEVNPVTGETARKATGSYYTPRTIVDYMVEQSLKQYLLTKTSLSEDKITTLLSYDDNPQEFNPAEKEAVVKASKEIRIIDPACGSGAFPMGILHRMLLVLERVDPKLEIWRRQYLSTLDSIVRQTVEKNVKRGNWVYIRKLMIIRDSIYGVDIQPIAVEIAKLRCFLSLVVDELVLDDEENRGIEPLPNLEFKFLAANTLIGLPIKINDFGAFDTKGLTEELRGIRKEYLTASGNRKEQMKRDFLNVQAELREKIDWALPSSQSQVLAVWDPFSYESNGWFNPDWMFGIEGGFDVVIANPPYLKHESLIEKEYLKKHYESYHGMADIYTYFIEKGFSILHKHGTLSYIVSNRFSHTNYGRNLRRFLGARNLISLINLNGVAVFENANVDTLIIISTNHSPSNKDVLVCNIEHSIRDTSLNEHIKYYADHCARSNFVENAWSFEANRILEIRSKMENNNRGLCKLGNIRINRGITTGLNSVFIIDEQKRKEIIRTDSASTKIIRPILKGEHIRRWCLKWADSHLIYTETDIDIEKYPGVLRYLYEFRDDLEDVYEAKHGKKAWYELRGCKYYSEFEKEKIVYTRLSSINSFAISTDGEFCVDSAGIIVTDDNKYYCAILNSTLIYFYFKLVSVIWGKDGIKWFGNGFDNIPIHEIDSGDSREVIIHDQIVISVDNILAITKEPDYLTNPAKQARVKELEGQIDQMVYELYGLTPEEIAVVEGKDEKNKVETE